MANYSKNLYSKSSIKKDNTPSPLFIYHITSPLRMKKTLLLTLFFLCSATLFAQTVKGVLTDEETGEAIPFANVVLDGTRYGAATDINGFFLINKMPEGSYTLRVRFVGYEEYLEPITLSKGQTLVRNISLKTQSKTLKTVVITDNRIEERKIQTQVSVEKITPSQIQQLPSIGGTADPAQYLQVLPGVNSTGDQGGQLYIRGGSMIQNLCLLDGMIVYNPFHSIGLYSIFETDVILNADIYSGGFGAEYGGRISSVMDITTRDGNKKRHTGKIGLNTFGANIVLGSATPSYESYYNALNGRYHLVEITERFGGVQMPEIILSDMRVERRRKTMKADFGSTLLDAMKETLEEHNQTILFQNRRGFSLRLECDDCHHVPQCINCDVSLIYHKSQNVLRCHYCGYTASVPTECPVCHSPNIRMHGFGTEKIEEDLSLVMPEAKVARLDLDTTRSKNDYQNILEAFQDKETNILVGTQMVTKGLDFDSVKVVGILNADNMLSFPDFRAHERSFQLMAQVAGRAGRKGKQGKVIIQTYEPAHPVLQDVLRNDFRGLYDKQMVIRRQFGYPPFYRLILIRLKHQDYQKLNPAAAELAAMLRPIFKQDLLGPEYPVVSRVKNLYIKQMMVKFRRDYNTQKVKELIAQQIRSFQQNSEYKAVQVQIDVDPM